MYNFVKFAEKNFYNLSLDWTPFITIRPSHLAPDFIFNFDINFYLLLNEEDKSLLEEETESLKWTLADIFSHNLQIDSWYIEENLWVEILDNSEFGTDSYALVSLRIKWYTELREDKSNLLFRRAFCLMNVLLEKSYKSEGIISLVENISHLDIINNEELFSEYTLDNEDLEFLVKYIVDNKAVHTLAFSVSEDGFEFLEYSDESAPVLVWKTELLEPALWTSEKTPALSEFSTAV